ncbi:prolyl oligopeptidase family serine peptidase [Rapidithrix thailandica]|uniref:Prolyl oligopeptidase family serine peptidase n=1 Tax=Rapidithrix thailandica TaxID=413964 RepID=A0AAW9SDA1_9BACT
MKKTNILLIVLTLAFHLSQAQSPLTIDQIMKGEEFVGHLPGAPYWGEDGKTIYFRWNPEGKSYQELYKFTLQNPTPVKVSQEEQLQLPSSGGTYNKDFSKKVYAKHGDLFLLNIQSNSVQQITNTLASESQPVWVANEEKVAYRQGNNLYTWDIQTGKTEQITQFINGSKPAKNKTLSSQDEWLTQDQLAYFEVLKERHDDKKERKEFHKGFEAKRPLKIYLEKQKKLQGLSVSPDGQYIVYRTTKPALKQKPTHVPDFVTESGYTENLNARPKVGTPQPSYELGIYNRATDTTYLIEAHKLEGIYQKPLFLKEYTPEDSTFREKYEAPKKVYFSDPLFSKNSKFAIINIRSLDNKDRWLTLLDLTTGKLKTLDWQHDEAWVAGPGIGWVYYSSGNFGWLEENKKIWFQSEASGYSHLYSVDIHTGKKQTLTKGNFEINQATLSQDKAYFYLISNKEHPGEQHFYRMPSKGGKMTKITSQPGKYEVAVSPDEKHLAVLYSFSNKPSEVYLMENKAGAGLEAITQSLTPEFKAYPWRTPKVIQFEARDGAKVHARIYRPENPEPNGKAVIFVHGAGYLQNAHRWWSSYYREYMFHNFLTDQGYTVLDIDYRASAGYGRDWRTGIYRHMGGKDLTDQVDGANFLTKEYNIDPKRIGIYGGSYGGFITLMAMFKEPGVFKSGAALRSVTDWAHYNHGYTANILNTPEEDSLAYRRSSPIYFAEGLQDRLLILHGMVDTNVQYQDVVRLAQRLIELRKENWEMAVFPMEGHGFVEPSSWADEYKRIFKLFEETL